MKVAVIGASGYVGGEVVRLLGRHPKVESFECVSETHAGERLGDIHPHLRRHDVRFKTIAQLNNTDVLISALPHKTLMYRVDELAHLAPRVIDLSADFRLANATLYSEYYGIEHPAPQYLTQFVLGIPELNRERLRGATRVSVPGCMALAGIYAIHPAARQGLVMGPVTVVALSGSSGSGSRLAAARLHTARTGLMSAYQATNHRHEVEIAQICHLEVHMTAVAVQAVRGISVICRAPTGKPLGESDVWQAYRDCYKAEPFVRIVRRRKGILTNPDPRILAGTNYCDVGFAIDRHGESLVMLAALDNLVKGAAGCAIQCLNVMCGWGETDGLDLQEIYP